MTNCDLEHYLLNWQTGSYLWFMAHFKRDCLFPRGETGSWNGLLVVASEKTRSRKRSWRRWQSSRAPPCTAGKMTTAVRKLNSSYTQWNYVDYVYVYLSSSIAILWFSWKFCYQQSLACKLAMLKTLMTVYCWHLWQRASKPQICLVILPKWKKFSSTYGVTGQQNT